MEAGSEGAFTAEASSTTSVAGRWPRARSAASRGCEPTSAIRVVRLRALRLCLAPLRTRRAETTDRESGEAISRSVACSGDGTERASAVEQCVGASAPLLLCTR